MLKRMLLLLWLLVVLVLLALVPVVSKKNATVAVYTMLHIMHNACYKAPVKPSIMAIKQHPRQTSWNTAKHPSATLRKSTRWYFDHLSPARVC